MTTIPRHPLKLEHFRLLNCRGSIKEKAMSRKLFVSALLLVLLLPSCKIEQLDNPIIVPLVDQEFNLALWEVLSPSGSTLDVQMRTVLNEPCINTTILSDYQKSGNQLELVIFEILPPEDCQPGVAPAFGSETLEDATSGVNNIQVELQGVVVNSGKLTITDTRYTVEMDTEDGIGWEQYELLKIPTGALWGYVTFQEPEQVDFANDFFTQLTERTAPLYAEDGYYGYFELSDEGNQLEVKDQPEAPFQQRFLLQFYGEEMEIDELVTNFRSNAPDGVEVKVLDFEGNVW